MTYILFNTLLILSVVKYKKTTLLLIKPSFFIITLTKIMPELKAEVYFKYLQK